jgi:hypothetical protein
MVAIQSEVSNPWFATCLATEIKRERSHGMIAKTDSSSSVPLHIGIRRRFFTVTRSSKHNFDLFFIKKYLFKNDIFVLL